MLGFLQTLEINLAQSLLFSGIFGRDLSEGMISLMSFQYYLKATTIWYMGKKKIAFLKLNN